MVFFVQMGGLMVKEGDEEYRVVPWNDLDTIKIPAIREKEIKDHGKGDIFAKFIVVLQTIWFVVQCIARRVEGLVLTELELVTLAFATLNVIMYILWWDKPLNVEYPIYFDREGNRVDGPGEKEEEAWYKMLWKEMTDRSRETASSLERRSGAVQMVWEHVIRRPFALVFGPLLEMANTDRRRDNRKTSVHPFYAARLGHDQYRLAYFCAAAIGVVFGGIHLIGWNFSFLATTELWLWRASSLVLTVTPAFHGLISLLMAIITASLTSFSAF
ncbi:hypothetical protein AX16_000857 [Volvariella volvacea WC 439]|nr:hypothetical protein AX16_000857 [Volvariella volvacea WC 439]